MKSKSLEFATGKEFLIIFLSVILIFNGISFSSENIILPKAFGESDVLTWKMIFVTTWDNCSSRNLKALVFYQYLTGQYLTKYNINHQSARPSCVSTDNMSGIIQGSLSSYDLVIIIPDLWQSFKQQRNSNSLGHYNPNDDSRSIISQAFSYKVESKSSAWVLSHELSHFALQWKGYPHEVYGNGVHAVQSAYNKCQSNDFSGAMCPYLWDTITTTSGKQFPVMKPIYTKNYKQPPSTYSQPSYPQTTQKTIESHEDVSDFVEDRIYQEPPQFQAKVQPYSTRYDPESVKLTYSKIMSYKSSLEDLEYGIDVAQESIKNVRKYDSSEANEEVHNAREAMKEVERLINIVKFDQKSSESFMDMVLSGDPSYNPRRTNLDVAEMKIDKVERRTDQIGFNLMEISERLDSAEKLQEQYEEEKQELEDIQEKEVKTRFCFLWWCF